jgi:hypothetical protein
MERVTTVPASLRKSMDSHLQSDSNQGRHKALREAMVSLADGLRAPLALNYEGLICTDPTPDCIGVTRDGRTVLIDWGEVFPAKVRLSVALWKDISLMYVGNASTVIGNHVPKAARSAGVAEAQTFTAFYNGMRTFRAWVNERSTVPTLEEFGTLPSFLALWCAKWARPDEEDDPGEQTELEDFADARHGPGMKPDLDTYTKYSPDVYQQCWDKDTDRPYW